MISIQTLQINSIERIERILQSSTIHFFTFSIFLVFSSSVFLFFSCRKIPFRNLPALFLTAKPPGTLNDVTPKRVSIPVPLVKQQIRDLFIYNQWLWHRSYHFCIIFVSSYIIYHHVTNVTVTKPPGTHKRPTPLSPWLLVSSIFPSDYPITVVAVVWRFVSCRVNWLVVDQCILDIGDKLP